MTEESYIQEKVGKRNPFQVPEGYFEHFTAQLMQQLPEKQEQKPHVKHIWLRPAYYAVAASVCALVVSVAVYLWQPDTVPSSVAQISNQDAPDDSFDQAADYMMLDNHDIYACLADY